MRLLAPQRISRLTSETTSIDTRLGLVDSYARMHGHILITWPLT